MKPAACGEGGDRPPSERKRVRSGKALWTEEDAIRERRGDGEKVQKEGVHKGAAPSRSILPGKTIGGF